MVWPADSGELLVTGMMEDTSAVGCGLEENDILIAVDGASIRHLPAADASHLLSGRFNSTVEVEAQRGTGENTKIIKVTLTRDVHIDVAVDIDADVGVTVWPDPNGALVISSIKEGTSAASSGLQPGDVISMVDDIDVSHTHAGRVAKMLKGAAGSEVCMAVSRLVNGTPSTVMMTVTRDVYIESLKGVVTEGGCMVYTNEQKAIEDELFGPFVGMRLSSLPEPEEVWDLLVNYIRSYVMSPKVGITVFTQFLHWLSMQELAFVFADDSWMSAKSTSPFLATLFDLHFGDGEQVVTKEMAFEFSAQVIDALVPALCPELFKMLDHNMDGELSKAEWTQLVAIMHSFSCRRNGVPTNDKQGTISNDTQTLTPALLSFIFTIIDKDQSRDLSIEEITNFTVKMAEILGQVIEACLRIIGHTLIESLEKDLVEDLFGSLDYNDDGVVTADELLFGFPPAMLQLMRRVPELTSDLRAKVSGAQAVAAAPRGLPGLKAKAANAVCEVASALLDAFGSAPVTRAVFQEQVKALVHDLAPSVLEACFNELLPIPASVVADLRQAVESGAFESHVSSLGSALFELLDLDLDGRVTREQIGVYSKIVLDRCESDGEAKQRLLAIFAALDIHGEGQITKEVVENWVSKVWGVFETWTMLCVALGLEALKLMSPQTIAHIWRGYTKYKEGSQGQEAATRLTRLDAVEFERLFRTGPLWWSDYALPCLQEGQVSESLWSTIFNDLVQVPGEDLLSLANGTQPPANMPVFSETSGVLSRVASRTATRCPLDHKLQEIVTPEEGWGCDACEGDSFPTGTVLYGCTQCRWACCKLCFGDAEPESESSSEEEEQEEKQQTSAQTLEPARSGMQRQPVRTPVSSTTPLRVLPEDSAPTFSPPQVRGRSPLSSLISNRDDDTKSVGSYRSSRSMRSVSSKLPGGMLLDNPNVPAADKVEAYRQYKEEETRRRAEELEKARQEVAAMQMEAAKAASKREETIKLKEAEVARREAAVEAMRRKEADIERRELQLEQVRKREEALKLREQELEELAVKQADLLKHEAELQALRHKEAVASAEEAAAREKEALQKASEQEKEALRTQARLETESLNRAASEEKQALERKFAAEKEAMQQALQQQDALAKATAEEKAALIEKFREEAAKSAAEREAKEALVKQKAEEREALERKFAAEKEAMLQTLLQKEALTKASAEEKEALTKKFKEEAAAAAAEKEAKELIIKQKESALKMKEQEIAMFNQRTEAEAKRREAELEAMREKEEDIARREAEIRQRDDEIKRREEAVQAAQQAAEKSKEMDAAAMAEQKRKDEVAAAKRKRDSEKAEAAIRRREEEIKEALKSAKVKEDEARNLEKQLQANATKEMELLEKERQVQAEELKKQMEALKAERERDAAAQTKREAEAKLLRAEKERAEEMAARAAEEKAALEEKASAANRAAEIAAAVHSPTETGGGSSKAGIGATVLTLVAGAGIGQIVLLLLLSASVMWFVGSASGGCEHAKCVTGVTLVGPSQSAVAEAANKRLLTSGSPSNGLLQQFDNRLLSGLGWSRAQPDQDASLLGVFANVAECEKACLDTLPGGTREGKLSSKFAVVAGFAGVTVKYKDDASGERGHTDTACVGFTFFSPAAGHADSGTALSACHGHSARERLLSPHLPPHAPPG